ncbi:MAG: ATP synthase F1 subunit delta [Myxococcota bacterium]|nr:ATP synthase F1 subunit delta [Myxococcota bacterium]
MSSNSLARRYARALISLGKEENNVDQIGNELQEFQAALQELDHMLGNFLNNPGITKELRKNVLRTTLSKMNLHHYTVNFLSLLMDKGRMDIFPEILSSYKNMADQLQSRLNAEVVTSQELDILNQNTIRQSLAEAHGISPEKLIIQFSIDPEIIGGIFARVGDTIYDGTIRSQLQELKQTLISNS